MISLKQMERVTKLVCEAEELHKELLAATECSLLRRYGSLVRRLALEMKDLQISVYASESNSDPKSRRS